MLRALGLLLTSELCSGVVPWLTHNSGQTDSFPKLCRTALTTSFCTVDKPSWCCELGKSLCPPICAQAPLQAAPR